MHDCACEAKRPATICEISKRNGELAEEINVGMGRLLELLIGPERTENGEVMKHPTCLQEDVARQNITLGQIHDKLNRAYAALNICD